MQTMQILTPNSPTTELAEHLKYLKPHDSYLYTIWRCSVLPQFLDRCQLDSTIACRSGHYICTLVLGFWWRTCDAALHLERFTQLRSLSLLSDYSQSGDGNKPLMLTPAILYQLGHLSELKLMVSLPESSSFPPHLSWIWSIYYIMTWVTACDFIKLTINTSSYTTFSFPVCLLCSTSSTATSVGRTNLHRASYASSWIPQKFYVACRDATPCLTCSRTQHSLQDFSVLWNLPFCSPPAETPAKCCNVLQDDKQISVWH